MAMTGKKQVIWEDLIASVLDFMEEDLTPRERSIAQEIYDLSGKLEQEEEGDGYEEEII